MLAYNRNIINLCVCVDCVCVYSLYPLRRHVPIFLERRQVTQLSELEECEMLRMHSLLCDSKACQNQFRALPITNMLDELASVGHANHFEKGHHRV